MNAHNVMSLNGKGVAIISFHSQAYSTVLYTCTCMCTIYKLSTFPMHNCTYMYRISFSKVYGICPPLIKLSTPVILSHPMHIQYTCTFKPSSKSSYKPIIHVHTQCKLTEVVQTYCNQNWAGKLIVGPK